MVIRKIQTNHTKIIKAFFVTIAIFLVIAHLISIQQNKNNPNVEDIIALSWIEIGESVYIQGTIYPSNNFPIYTHSIITKENDSFALKSTNINLNILSGNIHIYGKIADRQKGVYIIEVEKIRQDQTIINNKQYILLDHRLAIDLESIPGSYLNIQDPSLTIQYENYPLAGINFLDCEKNPNNEFCIIDYNDDTNVDSKFVSARGYSFYKINETRILRHGTKYIYIIDVEIDQDLLEIAHIFRPIDTRYILARYQSFIKDYCENRLGITNIDKSYVDFENTTIYYIEETEDNTCTIGFDLRYSYRNPILPSVN